MILLHSYTQIRTCCVKHWNIDFSIERRVSLDDVRLPPVDVAHREFKEGDEVEVKSIAFLMFLSKIGAVDRKEWKPRDTLNTIFKPYLVNVKF